MTNDRLTQLRIAAADVDALRRVAADRGITISATIRAALRGVVAIEEPGR